MVSKKFSSRLLILLGSFFGYVVSLMVLSFMILWLYPWDFMPFTIDRALFRLPINSYFVDIGLIVLFGLQHSLMARVFFKKIILKNFNEAILAVIYSLASSFALIVLLLFWQPINGIAWEFKEGFWYWFFLILYVFSWLSAFIATFMIDHFALFGLQQGYRVFKKLPPKKINFSVRYFYKYVRHPIQAATIVGLFATPYMSYGHLLFAVTMSIYIIIGLKFEEKALIKEFGIQYQEYQKTTPMLIPFLKINKGEI